MNALNPITAVRNIALASCLFLGFGAGAGEVELSPKTKPFSIDSQTRSHIEDKLNKLSPARRASLWASLMDGEVVAMDGQLAVVWASYNENTDEHRLMLTNFGDAAIDEQCRLVYLDQNDKAFPVLSAGPNSTGSTLITALNQPNQGGTDKFVLYDEDDHFLAQLEWDDVRWLVVYYN